MNLNTLQMLMRHDTTSIQCVFGLNLTIDLEKPEIQCKVCNKIFENYGVDYQLYNDITKLVKIHQVQGKILLRYIVKDGIILLCTTQPISVDHKFLHLDAKIRLNLTDKILSILQESQDILFDLYDIYDKRVKQKLLTNHLPILKQQRSKIPIEIIKDVIKLKQLSKSTIKSIFTFTFIKKNLKTNLIVYYIEHQVWKEYELKLNEQPLDIYDFALYLKDEQNEFNYIYSLGGRQSELCPSARFIRIKFPGNPFTNIQATVENLPPLPKPTERLLGGIYQNKIYIFNGSSRTVVGERIREDFSQLSHYFDNQWKQLNISLCQRYCGSIYNYQSKYGFVGVLIGGIQRVPDGRKINCCEFQENLEFFKYDTQTLFGKVQLKLNDNPPNTKQLFNGEMLLIPSKFADTCDFITGQCLDNQKYSLNLAQNKLLKIHQYAAQFDVLYLEDTVNNKRIVLQYFMDYQGQLYNGRFYVMAKKPQDIYYLIKINPKSGEVEQLSNNQTNQQYEKKKEQYEKLDDEGKIIPLV